MSRTGWLLVALWAGCTGGGEGSTGGTSTLETSASDDGSEVDTSVVDPGDADTDGVDTGAADTGTPPVAGGACSLGDPYVFHDTLEIPFEGTTRTAIIDVPDDYDGTELVPLVLNFHGLATTAQNQKGYTGMASAGNARGWIVVHPNGTNRSWDYLPNSQDVRFVDALIDQLSEELCIDEKRIYLTGLSNGGFFSYQFACDRGDKVAAIAPVAGAQTDPFCNPGTKVPVLHIHGTDDNTVSYDGGLLYPSARASVSGWARDVNDCDQSPTVAFEVGDVTCETWSCSGSDEASLCTVEGGGHTWPGALPIPLLGATNQDIDATEEVLDFFARWARP